MPSESPLETVTSPAATGAAKTNKTARSDMADTLAPTERSERMARVRGKDTKPELVVRRLVHGMGYRYRLHRRSLPGIPDLVFPARRKVIFIHGCFWHRHPDSKCKLARLPKSRLDFWKPKLDGNRQRDEANEARLRELGWRVLVVWECQIGNKEHLREGIRAFLGGNKCEQSSSSPAPVDLESE